MTYQMPAFIADETVLSNEVYAVFDPSTTEEIAQVNECSTEDVDRAAQAADRAAAIWREVPVATRAAVLARASNALQQHRDLLIRLAIHDAGATRKLAASSQIDPAIQRLTWWSTQHPDVLTEDAVPSNTFNCDIKLVPVGVVAAISPFNFPLLSMVGKIAPALFSGNAVIMKPAPQDPLMIGVLAEALREALRAENCPPAVVSCVTGSAPELGSRLVEHPQVRSISFTGSTAVGRKVALSASANFKTTVLELGGKGALIARADANIEQVVAALRETWTVQAGQKCRTPTRLLAHTAVYDAITKRLSEELGRLIVGSADSPSSDVGPVISVGQRDAVLQAINAAKASGHPVLTAPVPMDGWFAPPTLVLDCMPEDRIMQEEVFGPLIAAMKISDDKQAIQVANATPYALSDYIFSNDTAAARQMSRKLHSGGIAINTTQRYEHAPFGGNRDSGIGREGGLYSLEACTVRQTITTNF